MINYKYNNMNIRTFSAREEALIIDDFNKNRHMAVEAIQKVADALEYVSNSTEVNWEDKYAIDDEVRKCVEYVLWIERTVAFAARTYIKADICVAYDYDEKLLSFSVGEFQQYAHDSIRIKNGFALFMAICAYACIKPKRIQCFDANGKTLPIWAANTFRIFISQVLYTKAEFDRVKSEVKDLRAMSYGQLLVHKKNVTLVLNTLQGKKAYVSWLEYATNVYQQLNPGYYDKWNGQGFVPYRNMVTNLQVHTSTGEKKKSIGICSYQEKDGEWHWTGEVNWLPGNETDYEKYIEKYPERRLPELHY